MKFLKLYILVFLVPIMHGTQAQEKLSLEDAVKIALQNNYDIKLSKNYEEISKNNVTVGNAGMLPVITGNLTNANRIESSKVDLSNGGTREADNAKTTNLNYGTSMNWKIFDGFQMFANYDRLKELEKLGTINAKLTIQNTVADVIATYYDLAAQEKQLSATETALEVSNIRLKNAKSRYTIGKGSKLELLAAQVDLNTDTTQLLRQQDLIRAKKVLLNEILARPLETPFEVHHTIIIDKKLSFQQLKEQSESLNPNLQTAVINQKIAQLNLKQIKGGRYPVIALTSGYNFAKSTSPPTGFAIASRSNGLNYGLTASLNVFNGFQQNRLEKNAKIDIDNSEIELQKIQQNIYSQLLIAFQNYQTNLQLVDLESNNLNVAQQNLNINLERYHLGSIVPLELREAQRNFIDANARYTNAQFEAKLAEISLKEITGSIEL
jgi:outer membrane protein